MSATLLDSPPLPASPAAARTSRTTRWAGRILTGLVVLLLAFDTAMKFIAPKEAIEGTLQLGYQLHHLPIIGTIAAVCLIMYVIPRTAPLGAVLWTGYFGGAVATHLRLDNPLLTHTLFPIYVAVLVWGALYLRDQRVRALLRPVR